MESLLVLAAVFAALIALRVLQNRQKTLSDEELRRARSLRRARGSDPEAAWDHEGSETETDGLRIRFRHADDPQGEVLFLAPDRLGAPVPKARIDLEKRIDLPERPETFHLHWEGWVFRIRLRGTGPLVGAPVELRVDFDQDGFVGGGLEPEDAYPVESDAWIEVDEVEILRLPDAS